MNVAARYSEIMSDSILYGVWVHFTSPMAPSRKRGDLQVGYRAHSF